MSGTIAHHCETCGAYVVEDGHDEQACADEHHRQTYRDGAARARQALHHARDEEDTTP